MNNSTTNPIYSFIQSIPFLTNIIKKGGIRLKWVTAVSALMVIVISIISFLLITISEHALIKANDKLCQTIAHTISSSESFLTAEKRALKRSMILQDIVKGLSKTSIEGFVYAAVYDLNGILAEKKYTYAAHTNAKLHGKYFSKDLVKQFESLNTTVKERIELSLDSGQTWCYRYRIPFEFFKSKVGIIEIVFTEDAILGPVHKARLLMLIIAAILLSASIYAAMRIARQMVQPLVQLTTGVIKVKDGDLTTRIDVTTHDEIGILTEEFNTMIDHLREKLKMQKFVSESTISMIREKRDDELDLGGTNKNMAFLFSDIRGFTAMSEKLPPEQVVSILNEYLDLQAAIIKKHGGDIDKFVGDEIMAVFEGDNKAESAVEAAVDIIESIQKLNKQREKEGAVTITVGIGIHMGNVVHGRMGSKDRMDFTSIGDAVNLSARLCSHADAQTILVSEAIIINLSKKKFKGKKLGPIKVKGKEQPIPIFQITGKA
ncbi:MAG TPA: adenylate/guanylate cyclase domain-containing protein [Spirochaetota bacterium]|nr:adenylate/guanylate cyclase domain-containing protein [Spirochaetota bacterium]HRV16308.1 adenylate/guanylate cyclase domain-containing protein [Spirochaetota bacterium]